MKQIDVLRQKQSFRSIFLKKKTSLLHIGTLKDPAIKKQLKQFKGAPLLMGCVLFASVKFEQN